MGLSGIILLLIAGLMLNYAVRAILRRGESVSAASSASRLSMPMEWEQNELEDTLRRWGQPGPPYEPPPVFLPLPRAILDVLSKFERVMIDDILAVDRARINWLDETRRFVTIGDLGEGSRFAVARAASDEGVYIEWAEDPSPDGPDLFALSFGEFVCKCRRINEGSYPL